MADADYTTLQLGPVTFTGFELPEALPFGGEQRTIVNEFAGTNKREIQVLGAQPRPITWRGAFYYDTAIPRARFLDAMRVQGNALTLTWGEFQYIVVISSFQFAPANRFNVPYEITLTVIEDQTLTAGPSPSRDTIDQGILGVLTTLDSIVAILKQAVGAVQAAQRGGVQGIIGGITGVIGAVSTSASVLDTASAAQIHALSLQATIVASQAKTVAHSLDQLSPGNNPTDTLVQASSSLSILAGLLIRLVAPPFVKSFTAVGDNLFSIASRFYNGNLDAWEAIANFNNIPTALVTAPKTVQLPPVGGRVPSDSGAPGTVYEVGIFSLPNPGSTRGR